MVDLGADLDRVGERMRADGGDHELLEVDRVVGVHAAVEHVQARHRQQVRLRPAQITPQRLPEVRRGGAGGRHRHAEDRVRTEARLPRSAVKRDHRLVQAALITRVAAAHALCDLAIDVGDRVRDPLAAERAFAVSQLDRFTRPG